MIQCDIKKSDSYPTLLIQFLLYKYIKGGHMARSVNKVQLIGNLTRDPELRYTPSGAPITTFTVATNRDWTAGDGQKHSETEFTKIVTWQKLAELCSQLLKKGTKVYIEGRLSTRQWKDKTGIDRQSTEVVAEDMIVLSPKGTSVETVAPEEVPDFPPEDLPLVDAVEPTPEK